MIGKKVYHSKHGSGTVQITRKAGLECQVRFDSHDILWVRADELEFEGVVARPGSQTPSPKSNLKERKIIEALRLGIVPEEGLEIFTHGREQEIASIKHFLLHSDEGARLLIGPYGTGKTHLLNYLRIVALDLDYAVAVVEMDAQSAPFSKPKRVYSQILQRLTWPDSGKQRNWLPLLSRFIQSGQTRAHPYFGYVKNTSDIDVLEWIDGSSHAVRPIRDDAKEFPALYDFQTAANVYCYLLSSIGAFCRGIGLKGLLVLFDESEALFVANRGARWEYGVNFLDALVRTANGDRRLLVPAYQTDLHHAGHASHVPFLYGLPSCLKLVFAFTNIPTRFISDDVDELGTYSLEMLDYHNLALSLQDLAGVYGKAYPGSSDGSDLESQITMLKGRELQNTRAVVKGFVEAMDLSRFKTYDPDREEDAW